MRNAIISLLVLASFHAHHAGAQNYTVIQRSDGEIVTIYRDEQRNTRVESNYGSDVNYGSGSSFSDVVSRNTSDGDYVLSNDDARIQQWYRQQQDEIDGNYQRELQRLNQRGQGGYTQGSTSQGLH